MRLRIPFREMVDEHTSTVFLDMPTMGWTVLRAAYALSRKGVGAYASTMFGYRVVEYESDNVGVQVSDIDGNVIYVDAHYGTVFLSIVDCFDRGDFSKEPGAYDVRMADFERRLLAAVVWMRENDPLPGIFSVSKCRKKGKVCFKEVAWDERRQTNVCPDHGPLKRTEVSMSDHHVFDDVPLLPR